MTGTETKTNTTFRIDSAQLAFAITRAKYFTQKTRVPATSAIEFRAKGGVLTIVAGDGSMNLTQTLSIGVEAEFTVGMSAKALSLILPSLEGRIEVTVGEKKVSFNNDTMEASVLSYGDTNLVDLTVSVPESGDSKVVELVEFAKVLTPSLRCVSDDYSRPVLCGVYFDGAGKKAVATDTHRMSVADFDMGDTTFILPYKAASFLNSYQSWKLGESVTFTFAEQGVRISGDGWVIESSLIRGQFPTWERVVPESSRGFFSVDRDDFLRALKKLAPIASLQAQRVLLETVMGQLHLKSRSEDMGELALVCPIIDKDSDIEVALNCRYMKDVISTMPKGLVRVEYTEASRPTVFRSVVDPTTFTVIMPMSRG